jgi:tetratricopeptide (TPR) repeat protein
MQGFTAIRWGILFLFLVLVPFSVSGVNISSNISPEYADVQSFHSIDDASLALYEGQNALQNGRYDEALAAYTNATGYDPSFMAAWYLKAYSLTKLNRSQEALIAVDKALVLDPADRDSNNLKADILVNLGRGNEAATYRRTTATTTEHPSTPVPATTTKKAPINPMTLIAGLLGLTWIAGKYGKSARSVGKKEGE